MKNIPLSFIGVSLFSVIIFSCGKQPNLVVSSPRESVVTSNALKEAASDSNPVVENGIIKISKKNSIYKHVTSIKTTAKVGVDNNVIPEVYYSLVKEGKQEPEWSDKKTGPDINWEIKFHSKLENGKYTAKFNVVNYDKLGLKDKLIDEIKFDVDVKEPEIIIEKLDYKISENDNKRLVNLVFNVKGEDLVKDCNAELKAEDTHPFKDKVKIILKQEKAENKSFKYISETLDIPDNIGLSILADISCEDTFGNQSSIKDKRLIFAPTDLVFSTEILANKNKDVFYVKANNSADTKNTELKLKGTLKYKSGSKEITPNVIQREKSSIKIYLSKHESKTFQDLKDNQPIAEQNEFADNFSFLLGSAYIGKQKFWAIALRSQFVLNKEGKEEQQNEIIGISPIEVIIEKSGFDYTWLSQNQFELPVKDKILKLAVKVGLPEADSSPLKDKGLKLQYSVDNSNWVNVEAEFVEKTSEKGSYDISFKYPFDKESPFRVRVVGTSVVDLESFSTPSPTLVGLEQKNKDTKCKISASLASSYVCTNSNSNLKFVKLVLNSNSEKLSPTTRAELQCKTYVDTITKEACEAKKVVVTRNVEGSVTSVLPIFPNYTLDLFNKDSKAKRDFHIAINAKYFDQTDKYSITLLFNDNDASAICKEEDNSVIELRNATFKLQEDPFPCE